MLAIKDLLLGVPNSFGGGSRPGLGFGEEMFNRLLSAEKLGFG